jgi:hypothetical protein
MNWLDQIGNILQSYAGSAGGAATAPSAVREHFDQIAQVAPKSEVAEGLAEAFRSDQTPSFDQMVSNLFSHSDGEQRAGILNRLLAVAGPGILAQLPMLAGSLTGGQQITPQQAEKVPPETVQQMASQAEQKRPSIVDEVSGFYAEHPQVVKALGGAALAILIQKMANRER